MKKFNYPMDAAELNFLIGNLSIFYNNMQAKEDDSTIVSMESKAGLLVHREMVHSLKTKFVAINSGGKQDVCFSYMEMILIIGFVRTPNEPQFADTPQPTNQWEADIYTSLKESIQHYFTTVKLPSL